jgi:anti-sigma factor RsiW
MTMHEELAALADGTLAPDRRDAVLSWIEADPELAKALASQHAALTVIRGTANEPASDALRATVQAIAATAGEGRAAVARRRPVVAAACRPRRRDRGGSPHRPPARR